MEDMSLPENPLADLLREPHHDGSPLYLDTESPTLGWTVKVRVRTATSDPVEQIWIRTTYDAEPTYHPCTVVEHDAHTTWWQGDLPVHNPVTHYRFLLSYNDGRRQRWLTAAGMKEYDVPDAFDFKVSSHPAAPAWTRDAVVYQIFPDRFARSSRADARPTPSWAVPAAWDDEVAYESSDPDTPLQLFGGDLDGIVEHLDHVEETGGNVVYLTPVFPGESNHRYNATTFDHVDPLLGGDDAYGRLAEAVHARGWHLLGDLTTNHTGDTHEWFVRASQDPTADTRGWYYFHPDGAYECWMRHGTLPKLDHTDARMRRAMIEGPDSTVARWLRPPYSLDGWRIDVANMTGRLGAIDVNHEVARIVRHTATAENHDAWVIGEHNHDASGDIDGDGWHGTMNYSGFSWPIWSWVRAEETPARPFGRPVHVPRRPGPLVFQALQDWRARYGHRATAQSWNILSSHDSARIRTLTHDAAVHRVAAGLQFTLPGVPMVFAGDELGLEGVNGEDGRRPMPWNRRDTWDNATLSAYRTLARLRRTHVALRFGGLRWAYVDDDCLVYLREHPAGSVLVCARRAGGAAVRLDTGPIGLSDGTLLASTEGSAGPLVAAGGTVEIPAADGPGCWIWQV